MNEILYLIQRKKDPWKGWYFPAGWKNESAITSSIAHTFTIRSQTWVELNDEPCTIMHREQSPITATREVIEEVFGLKSNIEEFIENTLLWIYKIWYTLIDQANCSFFIIKCKDTSFNPAMAEVMTIQALWTINKKSILPAAQIILYLLKDEMQNLNTTLWDIDSASILRQIPSFTEEEFKRIIAKNPHLGIIPL